MSSAVVHARSRAEDRFTVGFDLDGVLMRNPFETCVLPRLGVLLKASPGLAGLEEQDAAKAVRRRVSEAWQVRMDRGDLVAAYDWDAIYRDVAREMGGEPGLAARIDVAAWVSECCGQDGHIEALPGAAAALAGLRERGTRSVVISNGFAAYQEPVLEALGLLGYFDAVITPERAGAAKPQRQIFEAAGRLDLFVGDTLVHDVLGARAAGVRSAWLPPRLPEQLVDLTPTERAEHPSMPGFVESSLAASPHTRFHPEANAESCRPDYVLARVDEVVDLVGAMV